MENDLAIHPENTDYTPYWKGAFANNNATKVEGACPYANNWMKLWKYILFTLIFNL